jgi:hypothetical protein
MIGIQDPESANWIRRLLARWTLPGCLLAWWRSPARPIPIVIAVAFAFVWRGGDPTAVASNPEAALADALALRGLACEADDITWIARPKGVWESMTSKARVLLRAHMGDEPNDLYLVDVRLSPEGEVLELGEAWNISETPGADESRPVVRGHVATYMAVSDGLYTGLHVLDLGGRGSSHSDFSRLQRTQMALTNLQHTGQIEGVVHDTYALEPVARHATFAWRPDGMVEVQADDRTVVIDPARESIVSGSEFVRVLLDERARPGNLVTWAVDRVRAMPSFGDDRMQWVKAVAFTALDRWHAQFSGGSTAQEVEDELGLAQTTTFAPSFTDPEVGWPPSPIKTVVSPLLPGEGQWIALDKDPFITPTPGGRAPAFVTSFVRPNMHRQDVRVYVTLWDPRQIELHIEAGAVEPVGASGEHGPGLVPRTPEVIKRMVAGFNGGFQAQHGEYGMQANGIEYLPPKPYAATVVELRDGSNAFGAWPGPPVGVDGTPGAGAPVVPSDIIALRQNLTALVQNGKFNPWGRTWWGGTPPGWSDQIHSTRSAICLTDEGFVGYFYSTSISAEDLAQGMLDARCAFGIHLDMNPGHAGFEFYDVAPEGELKPLRRLLQSDWEAEGKVPDMTGYVFRSRRMIRGMGHMLFPRYIQREARDFFYLTARPLLPGAPLEPVTSPEPDEGVWRTKGLPQHGFPYALATAWIHTGGAKLRVLRVDPRAVRPAAGNGPQAPTVLSLTAGTRGTLSLWWYGRVFSISGSAPAAGATILIGGIPMISPLAANARAAVGVQDEDGMLVWVELPTDVPTADAQTSKAMDALLDHLGCSTRMSLPGDSRAFLGGSLDLSGSPVVGAPTAIGARLSRDHAPDAHSLFDSTPIVPIQVWQPLQAKRVRYFYKPTQPAVQAAPIASAAGAEDGGTTAPSGPLRSSNRLQSAR